MPKFVVHYRMVVQPGRGDELVALYEQMIRTFDDEPGTEQYLLSRAADDPDVFWAHEIFTTRDAFDEHRAKALDDTFVPAIQELLASREALQGFAVMASGVEL